MESAQKIYDYICAKPGTKASQIALDLGLDKTRVSSLLDNALRGKVRQDNAYRWWPSLVVNKVEIKTEDKKETKHSKIIDYYLDCIGRDEREGLSVSAKSGSDLDYVELPQNPLVNRQYSKELFQDEDAKKLLDKIRRDKSNLTLFLGYPIRLDKTANQEDFKLQPVLIYQFQFELERKIDTPQISAEIPRFNFKVLQSLTQVDSGQVLDESLTLSEELGFNDPEVDFEIDEVVQRLRQIRPQWDWIENPYPDKLTHNPAAPISKISNPGIYNKAVLLIGERSRYTHGLEDELNQLKKLPDSDIEKTALGDWVNDSIDKNAQTDSGNLLDVIPLNDEQRSAVVSSLSKPLTIITGPPGTGKSQVVTSIVLNAAWKGKKVLFASKNNKAVDVVEARVNGLGTRPILLRLGANQHQAKLAEYLTTLLSATVTEQEEQSYAAAASKREMLQKRFQALDVELQKMIVLRNEVDALEQRVEDFRKEVTPENFKAIKNLDALKLSLDEFRFSLISADFNQQNLFIKTAWITLKNKRFNVVRDKIGKIKELSLIYNLSLPNDLPNKFNLSIWYEVSEKLKQKIAESEKIKEYLMKLEELQKIKNLEVISAEKRFLSEEILENAEELWKIWLDLKPARLSDAERALLGEYHAILKLIVNSNENGTHAGNEVFNKFYKMFPQIINTIPCWAVTSLSVKRHIRFEAGFFPASRIWV